MLSKCCQAEIRLDYIKNGINQYACSVCGAPFNELPSDSWSKEFDEKFPSTKEGYLFEEEVDPHKIKTFITAQISLARQEERKRCALEIKEKLLDQNGDIFELTNLITKWQQESV